MRRTVSTTWLSIALVTLAPAGCGEDGGSGAINGDPVPVDNAPEAVSATFCSAWVTCDCADYDDLYANEAECDEAVQAGINEDIAAGAAAGLTYSADCLGDLLATYEVLGCTSLSELLSDIDQFTNLYNVCKVFYGDDAAGTPCTESEDLPGDSCAQNLVCEDGVCVSTTLIAEGKPCQPGDLCEAGSFCAPVESASDYACTSLPGAGQTCLGVADLCDFDTYCQQSNKTCTALPTAGQPCAPLATIAGRCAENATCEAEQCVAAPKAGEPCTDVCEVGSSCMNEVCQVEAPLICSGDL